ncbi:hypothetical protein ALC53_02588 [Atta colombica]|uniref:Uncharacterized protein n=1 Tax=Atta colombica TaxID=520822 RepID=A0A195BQF4_9HYME|nr:hypothetical protein ALC53_02588 [Atta colombica]
MLTVDNSFVSFFTILSSPFRADKLRIAHYESRRNTEYFSRFAFQMDILMRFKLLTQKEEKEDEIQDLGRQVE